MTRGTTPTLTFTLPFAAIMLNNAYITFAQKGAVVLEKTLADCTATNDILSLVLTQEDTLKFSSQFDVLIQIRGITDGGAVASNIITATVSEILKDGVIS